MSLKSALGKAVGSAFSAVGDLASKVVYEVTTGSYNAATGDNTLTSSQYTLPRCILGKYNEFEVDRVVIHATDVKLTVPVADLPVTPNAQTDSVIYNGKRYNILNLLQDPSGSVYTIQLRAP